MKMGTIRSPCPYDDAARHALQIGKSATACDLALRLVRVLPMLSIPRSDSA
jgi:hypothetical protein